MVERAGAFSYVPVLSREPAPELLQGRLTHALTSGALEERAQATMSAEPAHVMLCGNPAMVDEAIALLGARGLKRHRTRTPGHITTEKYW